MMRSIEQKEKAARDREEELKERQLRQWKQIAHDRAFKRQIAQTRIQVANLKQKNIEEQKMEEYQRKEMA